MDEDREQRYSRVSLLVFIEVVRIKVGKQCILGVGIE